MAKRTTKNQILALALIAAIMVLLPLLTIMNQSSNKVPKVTASQGK